MISVFRPFWSYDVNATENWLTYMAQQGYHFVKFNRLTRRFYFEKAGTIMQRVKLIYRKHYRRMAGDKFMQSEIGMYCVTKKHYMILQHFQLGKE